MSNSYYALNFTSRFYISSLSLVFRNFIQTPSHGIVLLILIGLLLPGNSSHFNQFWKILKPYPFNLFLVFHPLYSLSEILIRHMLEPHIHFIFLNFSFLFSILMSFYANDIFFRSLLLLILSVSNWHFCLFYSKYIYFIFRVFVWFFYKSTWSYLIIPCFFLVFIFLSLCRFFTLITHN